MVSREMVRDWWRVIKRLPPTRLADYRAPLVGMEFVERRFGLEPFAHIGFERGRLSEALPDNPKFKNLNDDTVARLRYRLAARVETERVDQWAEAILRYCEIGRHNLENRVAKKWPRRDDAKLAMLQVTAFMLDYYEETRDLRYLNVALKLCDMGWIMSIRGTSAGLRRRDDDGFAAGLFGVRVLLMRDRALRRLERKVAVR